MEDIMLYIIGILLLGVFVGYSIRHFRRLPFPPGPKPLPIIGNPYDVPNDPQWEGYNQLSKKYGMSGSLEIYVSAYTCF